jgi:hypothetical protein
MENLGVEVFYGVKVIPNLVLLEMKSSHFFQRVINHDYNFLWFQLLLFQVLIRGNLGIIMLGNPVFQYKDTGILVE